MKTRWPLLILAVVALAVAGCDSGGTELSTTSSLVTGTTETPGTEPTNPTSTTLGEEDTTTTTLVGETVASSDIVVRVSTDNGEILYIVIPPGAYTDVDISNFIGDLKEADPELWGAEIFDEEDAVEAYLIPEGQRTEEQQQLVDEHHFASLVSGVTLRFQGPFEEFGEYPIGS